MSVAVVVACTVSFRVLFTAQNESQQSPFTPGAYQASPSGGDGPASASTRKSAIRFKFRSLDALAESAGTGDELDLPIQKERFDPSAMSSTAFAQGAKMKDGEVKNVHGEGEGEKADARGVYVLREYSVHQGELGGNDSLREDAQDK